MIKVWIETNECMNVHALCACACLRVPFVCISPILLFMCRTNTLWIYVCIISNAQNEATTTTKERLTINDSIKFIMGFHSFYHSISTANQQKIEQFIAHFLDSFIVLLFYRFLKFRFYDSESFFLLFFFVQWYENWLFFSIKNFNGHFEREKKWLDLGRNWTKNTTLKGNKLIFYTLFLPNSTAHFTSMYWMKFSREMQKNSIFVSK